MNPFFWQWKKKEPVITVNPSLPGAQRLYPNGFYRVLTVSGKPGGLGWNCNMCHFQISHDAPKSVQHCGHTDTLDPKAKLPTVQLVNPNPNTIAGRTFMDPDANGWDGEVEYDGNGVHPASAIGFHDPKSGAWRR